LSGEHYAINGRKVYTSGMDISDYCLLVARTGSFEKKQQGITNFLVDTKFKGIEVKKLQTLGQRAIGTTEVLYSDVKVPADMMLGNLGEGWKGADAYLCYERLCLSAARTGAARAAFDFALEHAKTRQQFGRPIGKFQAISHKFADMKTMLDIAETMTYRYAWLMENNRATRQDAAILKLYTGESYKAISDMCLQVLGGYGYCMEYPMQRFFRDSRLATIGAGTSEIQKNIIAASLGL
jgi:alkylation response protein AidB-like acyl-CoA dehydrogenase